MSRNKPHCELVEIDGEQVRVRVGKKSLSKRDKQALADLVRAVRVHVEEKESKDG